MEHGPNVAALGYRDPKPAIHQPIWAPEWE